jgi:hypothetical protein
VSKTTAFAANPALSPHRLLPEPRLVFDPVDRARTHEHPLLGLIQHGPYRGLVQPPLRVATISTEQQQRRLFQFLARLRDRIEPTDRKPYVPPFPGFEPLLGSPIGSAAESAHVTLPDDVPAGHDDGHEALAAALGNALGRLVAVREQWDVVVFLLPEAWERWRKSADGRFDLHDRLKTIAAPLGCPVQVLREQSALRFRYHCSLAWRLSIALFTKAGGVPWRLAATPGVETAYVGLAYAIRGGTKDGFVTCCSQVLDVEGGGVEFVAYDIGHGTDEENPHLTREEMRAVMARSARLYQDRHSGRLPRRAVVHKTSRWRDEEVDGALDAWSACDEVECITVQSRTPWRGMSLVANSTSGQSSKPHDWPVPRGTMQHLSGTEALLWVHGTAERASLRGTRYYQGGKGLPSPLLLTRAAGHGPLEPMASEVLALSKLDWNNDALYDPLPVTIKYSKLLAEVISNAPTLPDNVYQYRFFM